MAEAEYMNDIYPYIAPILMTLWVLGILAQKLFKQRNPWKTVIYLVPAALILSFSPFSGISLAGYILSANPIFSIGTTVLLFILVMRVLTGRELLSRRDTLIFAVFNVFLGLVLYSSVLGVMAFDIYRLGYGTPLVLIALALLTGALFIMRNPLSIIFLASLGAFSAALLDSPNVFDYLTDGVLFLFSCGILIRSGVKKIHHPAMIDRTK